MVIGYDGGSYGSFSGSLHAYYWEAEGGDNHSICRNPEPAVVPTTGGASDKVPDPNVEPVAVISIYHKGDGDSLVQEMDSLDDDDLNAQALVDRMIGYGVFTEGTEVISFDKTGEEENAKGVLNLNQAKNNEGVTETQFW